MSTHHPHRPEDSPRPASPAPSPQGRGYFFHIAVFFILIALLCYILSSSKVNWTEVPSPPAASTPK
jgi:hypothetical protein